METRPFGRTGYKSSLAIFGAGALGTTADPDAAQMILQLLVNYGVNHIDVAPSYGAAEKWVGSWMDTHRQHFFLNCKTLGRTAEAARAELEASLAILRVDYIDLYQVHAINSMATLNRITAADGALKAVVKARDEGVIKAVGITGHGLSAPKVLREALKRYPFDGVMFPINPALFGNAAYRSNSEALLDICSAAGVGVQAIKAVAKGPWHDDPANHLTWYEPHTGDQSIRNGVHFALSQPGVTGICTPSDPFLLPAVLEACSDYTLMPKRSQAKVIRQWSDQEPIFTTRGRVGPD